jgi:prepilin-type processing-associated H-X9-DG protein
MGLAVHNYHDSYGCFPTAGDNGGITKVNGIPLNGPVPDGQPFQQGGALVQLLPFIEQTNLMASSSAGSTPVKIYFCPSRRAPSTRVSYGGGIAAMNDYAMPMWKDQVTTNQYGGAGFGGANGGCWNMWSDTQGTLNGAVDNTNYPFYYNCIFVRAGKQTVVYSANRFTTVTDGTSNTIMLAEKYVTPSLYAPPDTTIDTLAFTDSGWTGGFTSWSTMRCSMNGPYPDTNPGSANWQMFGSAHPNGINAVFADGSVHPIKYGISNAIFQVLVRINDGIVVDMSSVQ